MSAERPLLVYLELTDEESGDEYRWDAEAADGETYFITYKKGAFYVGRDDQKELLIDSVITDGAALSVQRDELVALLDGTFDVSALNHPSHCFCGYRTMYLDDPLRCPHCHERIRVARAASLHRVPASNETYRITLGDIPLTISPERDHIWEGRDEENVPFLILCSGETASFARPAERTLSPIAFEVINARKRWERRAGEPWTLHDACFELLLDIDMAIYECPNCAYVDETPSTLCNECRSLDDAG